MSSIELFDFLLGIAWLAIIPLVLAAYGGHLAAQTLSEPKVRRRTIFIFWGLCFLGIGLAVLYQYRVKQIDDARQFRAARADSDRQKKLDEAQRQAMEAQVDLRAIEKANGDQIIWLQKRLDKVIASAPSSDQRISAQEIRKELADMAENQKAQVGLTQPIIVIPSPSLQPTSPAIPRTECRGNDLKDCPNEDLLEWGKPLVEKVNTIMDDHMAALKALDDITGNWAGFLFGKDKDSKWMKAYAEAQQNTADKFRDCCAENALRYHNELASRVTSDLQSNDSYDWVEKLLKPVKSKEWKQARSQSGVIIHIAYDLSSLQTNLDRKMNRSKMGQTSH